MIDFKDYNSLVLAYIGDAIYEKYIRMYLIKQGLAKVDLLQKEAVKYVSARSQAEIIKTLINENFFYETEMDIIKRARNHKVKSHPKNTDIITYKMATGLEAVIGYLHLSNNNARLDEIMKEILGE